MRAVVISEDRMKEILEKCRTNLELAALKEQRHRFEGVELQVLSDMHRAFNYHVCRAFDEIRESPLG